MKIFKQILFFLVLLIMVLPAIQKKFHLFNIKPLNGSVELSPYKTFSQAGWMDGTFQAGFDDWLEDHIGFRSNLVRLNNQLDYSLYKKPNALGVVIGKENYLFEIFYINAYNGTDFKGVEYIDEKCSKLKFVQDSLQKNGILLLPVFDPGKASFFSEYIPDRFLKEKHAHTNVSYYRNQFIENNIEYLDFHSWFMQMKDTTTYPLYPQLGIHWSDYGVALALDSLMGYIKNHYDTTVVRVNITGFEFPDTLRGVDDDIYKGMNLICEIPHYNMAYPKLKFIENPEAFKPVVTTIGDSYYWQIFGQGLARKVFSENIFRYYNKFSINDLTKVEKPVTKATFEEDVFSNDIILLMLTESTYSRFALGFIDDLYFYLKHGDKIRNNKKRLLINEAGMEKIRDKAHQKQIPVEEMVMIDAIWLVEQDLKNKNSE